MAGPAPRGSRGRGRSPRHASSRPRHAAASTVGPWVRGHGLAAPSPTKHPAAHDGGRISSPDRPIGCCSMKGLAPDEAANLTAFLCGIPIADVHWSLRQVNQLLFLRETGPDGTVRVRGRGGAPTALTIALHRSRRRTLLPPERSIASRSGADPPPGAASARSGFRYHPRMRPVITFLTDFGPSAPAVCRGVMFGICPDANIIDINHQVPRYSIRDGAGSLVFALPHMPVGTHVAVVDPGVGTERLAGGARGPPAATCSSVRTTACSIGGGRGPRRHRRGARAREPRADAPGHLVELPRPRHLRPDGRAPRRRRAVRVGRADGRHRAARPAAGHPPDGRRRRPELDDRPRPHLRQRHLRRHAGRPRGGHRAARARSRARWSTSRRTTARRRSRSGRSGSGPSVACRSARRC